MKFFKHALAAAALLVAVPAAQAETVKIGLLLTFSGPGGIARRPDGQVGRPLHEAAREGPAAGVTRRDRRPRRERPQPGHAKRLAQELITRDKVKFLAGFIYTPNAMAVAPLATEAKVPMIIMNAGTSVIVRQSPYIARTSFTMWQSGYPLGQWAAKQQGIKTATRRRRLRARPRHREFVQAAASPKPAAPWPARSACRSRARVHAVHAAHQGRQARGAVRVRPGRQAATALIKAYQDLGMAQAGIKLIGPGDITPDEELPNMADVPSGVDHHDAPLLRRQLRGREQGLRQAWKEEYGPNSSPSFLAVGAWDGMAAIFHAIREQKGKIDPDKTMALLKGWTNPNSPRGPITIDAETRDIVQNEYLRRLDKRRRQAVATSRSRRSSRSRTRGSSLTRRSNADNSRTRSRRMTPRRLFS